MGQQAHCCSNLAPAPVPAPDPRDASIHAAQRLLRPTALVVFFCENTALVVEAENDVPLKKRKEKEKKQSTCM
jgi:hypothetical protein